MMPFIDLLIILTLFFFYLFIVHLAYFFHITEGKTFKQRVVNYLSRFGNKEMIIGDTRVYSWEQRFIEIYNNWLKRLGSKGKLDKMGNHEVKPKKYKGYLALLFTAIRIILLPFRIRKRY